MNFITTMAKGKWVAMHYHLGGVSRQYCYKIIDGSTLSSLSLHVGKVAANSAIDAQIQVLVVYVHTYIISERLIWNPLVSPSSSSSREALPQYSYTRFHP